MTQTEVQSVLHDFITVQFPAANHQRFDANVSLINSGIIDSLGVLEIVTFVEQRFGVVMSDEELVSDYFDSIQSLAQLISTKLPHEAPCNR